MRKLLFLGLVAVLGVSCLVFSSRAENVSLRGDYVEVRTASVFAGACHYNGEVTTTGRDAMMAWSVSSGKWQGVDLAGVRAVAIVTFDHKDKSFNVVAAEATINVQAMPNDLCCKMPNMVWYKPLVGLENRKVGYTLNATYSGKSVGEPWGRSDENSAFYGTFSL
jgi:hypothetical protein